MIALLRAPRLQSRPAKLRNSVIVDIDRAPRNAQGDGRSHDDVEILRPSVACERQPNPDLCPRKPVNH